MVAIAGRYGIPYVHAQRHAIRSRGFGLFEETWPGAGRECRRSMLEFAEAEVIIPDGEYAGLKFKASRNPFARLWFEGVDSGSWSRFICVGTVQSGKTLVAFIIPICFHAVELGETVIIGCPTSEIAADKWRQDLLPIFQASSFAHLLPSDNPRLPKDMAIPLRNGATLKFMTGGGGDKSRASYTSRVVVATEIDAFDVVGGTSREGSKWSQLMGRVKSYPRDRQRIYGECTPSLEDARVWASLKQGTDTRISLLCPHCAERVTAANDVDDRKTLVGCQGCDSVIEASRSAAFACPHCGATWTEDERRTANEAAIMVHRGMEIDETGAITGDPPETDTFGFRWGPINNMLVPASTYGADVWEAENEADEEAAERSLLQLTFALPYRPAGVYIDVEDVKGRIDKPLVKGIVPDDCKWLTVGVDLGRHHSFYVVVAWRGDDGATSHVVDYGLMEVHSHELGIEHGLLGMLRELRDERCVPGWSQKGEARQPEQVYIDSGYMPAVVYQFCRESGNKYRPSKGFGTGMIKHAYAAPTKTGRRVVLVGEHYHAALLPTTGLLLVEFDADHWKRFAQQRLATPLGNKGAMTLFAAPRVDHHKFAMQITSEREEVIFVPGVGLVTKMRRLRPANHYLDATTLACIAGHACGARLTKGVATVAVAKGGPPVLDLRKET